MIKKICLAILLAGLLATSIAYAEEIEMKGYPEVLNYESRNAKPTRNEIFIAIGDYYGDSLENSWLVNGEYMFHFTRHFGLGADFGYSRADYGENASYATPGFFTNKNIYILDATGQISFPAAYKMGKHVIETELYILLGGGTININSSYEPHGFIGGGMKIYTGKPWLAVRVDLRDTFHTINKPGGDNEFDQDLLFMAGLSFQIPPKIK